MHLLGQVQEIVGNGIYLPVIILQLVAVAVVGIVGALLGCRIILEIAELGRGIIGRIQNGIELIAGIGIQITVGELIKIGGTAELKPFPVQRQDIPVGVRVWTL